MNISFLIENPLLILTPVQLPRFNRLTGLFWAKASPQRDDSEASFLKQDAAIRSALLHPEPCAIGKIGTSELLMLEYTERWIRLSWPHSASWRRPANRLFHSGGLFPVQKRIFNKFVFEYSKTVQSLDLVAQWQASRTYEAAFEQAILNRLCPHAVRVNFRLLQFFTPRAPWLDDLAKLRWLVIHPFEETIRTQLPHLAELGVYSESARGDLARRARDTAILACPQLPYMVPPRHRDWFEALEDLKSRMEKMEFDIALVGAGAWSLPLVAHAKAMGKKGMHLGGSLQLMFGIKGGRFDNKRIYNSRWTRPLPADVPANHQLMENGAYW